MALARKATLMGSHVLPALPSNPADPDRPWWLRMLRHSTEISVAGYSTTSGAIALSKASDPANFYAGPLMYLPTPLTYVITVLVCMGGALTLLGIVLRIKNLKIELITEQVGWFLMCIGWSAYIAGAHGYGEITGTTIALIWVAVGSAARVAALVLHQLLLARKQATEEKLNRIIERIEGNDAH